jgi:probable HAF family extracellular repeat protein
MLQQTNLRAAMITLAGLLATSQVAWAQPRYVVEAVPLSVAPGDSHGANAINIRGVTAVDQMIPTGGTASHRCTVAGCERISALDNDTHHAGTAAYGINDSGLVVGASPYQFLSRGYLFDGTTTKNLGAFNEGLCGGCNLSSAAYAINNVGQVVGDGETVDRKWRGFVWQNDQMQKLGTLGGEESWARAINDSGDVVGKSTQADGRMRAFLYRNGRMRNLGTLGGNRSEALAINAARQVVGCSSVEGETATLAFIYDAGTMTALKPLGGNLACAYGINKTGWVVGSSTVTPGKLDYQGFVYDGDQVYNLNDTLGDDDRKTWLITEARAINKKGQIAATGVNLQDGSERALVLTPKSPR